MKIQTKNTQKIICYMITLILLTTMIPSMVSEKAWSRATIYVDDDAAAGWYDATHVRTIQEGINNASSSDTVYVYNGTYVEHVIINKTIQLIGEHMIETIIDGGGNGDVITTLVDDITISNCTVRNAGNPPLSHSGILINSNNNTITNTLIKNNAIYGVNIVSSSGNHVYNNTMNNNGEAIRLYYATQNNIQDNIIDNNYYGMRNWYSTQNTIHNNTFYLNDNYGIFHKHCHQTIIENNIFSDSIYGVRFWNGSHISLTNNRIINNSIGLLLDSESNNNTVYNNYFSNDDNLQSTGVNNQWNITITLGTNIINGSYLGGNFWSDYTGYDIDADGIGDTNIPYGPGDYLPLVRANQLPTANFTFTPINPSIIDLIQFTDTSTDPDGISDIVNWTWDFGDGNISYEQSPTHIYATLGNYTVTLSVLDACGGGNTTHQTISIENLVPIASFIYDPLAPITSDTIIFNSTSIDLDGYIVNWTWDFNDGSYGYEENTTHIFDNGTFNVVLWVWDNEGDFNVTNQTITVINIHPTVDFSYIPAHPTTADMIYFTDLSSDRNERSIVNWSWDFGDGNISFTQDTSHRYADNGTYNVTLTITDNNGASNTSSKLITVSNIGPAVGFTFSPLNPLTSDTIQFNDTSTDSDGNIVNWSWDFGDGNTSFLQHPMHQYADNGTYNVSLLISDDDGFTNTTSTFVSVGNTPPVANFSYSPLSPSTSDMVLFNDSSIDADGSVVAWNWDFGDGNSSAAQHPMHSFGHAGIYIVSLTVTDNDWGLNTTTLPVTVSNVGPNASFTYTPLTPSSAHTVQFTDTSTDSDGNIVNWSWDFGDGNTSFLQNPSHRFIDNGTYTVWLTIFDNNGASDSTWVLINVSNAIPTPNFTWSPTHPTELDVIQFYDLSSDRSIASWNWDFGDGNLSSLQNPTHQYADDGTYNVTLYVSDDDGAINSITKLVTVYTIQPTANFTYAPMNPSTSDSVMFTDHSTDADGNIVNWSWDFGDGNTSFLQHPTHSYADDGVYVVNLTIQDDDNEVDAMEQSITVSNVAPSVNFTLIPSNATTADIISFTDLSFDSDGVIVSWYWDFGDGYQSTNQNPPHQYVDDGVYMVNLTIIDDDGASNTTIIPVTILNVAPVVSFSYTPLNPRTVDLLEFTDSSTDSDGSIVNWSWDFGDGNMSFDQHPTHSYTIAGNYTVNLTVRDDDGDINSSGVVILVDPRPSCFDEVWVDDDYNSSLWWWQITHFDSIQDGIDAVCPNGTVYVAQGVYDEQLYINKSLHIIGSGKNVTVITNTSTLTQFFTTSSNKYPIVFIENTSDVVIEGVTVDGAGNGNSNYQFIGVGYYNAGGILRNVDMKSIRDTPFSGSQHGVGVYAYDINGIDRNLLIEDCHIYDYQKNAMSLNGENLFVEVINNTITGAGPTNITAQNGIQIGYDAQGIIANNSVYGNWYTGLYWGASGGLVYSSDNIQITGNTFDTNQMAVYYYGSNGTIVDNIFINSEWSIVLWGDAYIYGNLFSNNTYDKTYMAEIVSTNHCFTYIQDAIDNAIIGDTVQVYDGEYDEDVTINKDLTVTGVNPPTHSAQINGVVTLSSDGATCSDLLIMPGNVSGNAAAVFVSASNVTVEGTIIDGITGDGTGSVKGIHVYSTSNDHMILIQDNQIKNVSNNGNATVYGGSDGISIQGVLDAVSVINNTIQDVWSYGWTYGIEITPTGSHPSTPPTNVVIEENTIDSMSATLYSAYASCISIDAYGSYPSSYYPANASEVTLQNNNFLNSSYGVINKDNVNILDATCNYWDHFTGPYHPVSNADGLGCVVTDNVTFIPWLDDVYPIGNCVGGQCTDPIWVDDDAATGWYDWDHVPSIQTAIDRICVGGTIYVAAGIYDENITIDKYCQIIGSGSDSTGTVITRNQSAAGDSRIGVVNIIASGISPSEKILLQDVRVEPDHLAGISVGRFTEATGTDVFYVTLDNVKVIGSNTNPSSEQERGLYVDLNSSLQYLEVYDSAFDNLTYGWYLQKQVSTDVSIVQYVNVENTTFNHNNLKGIYAEKLSDVTLRNCEISENGFSAVGVPSYFLPWMSGVDINLKAGSYKNFDFESCSFTDNALGGAKEGVGLTIKERGTGSDSSYAAFPASVDDVVILGCSFIGNERGIRFGEPGKNNVGPTNVTVIENNIYDNIKQYNGSDGSVYGGLVNVMQTLVNATCNWWGNESGPFNQTINPWGTGDNISGNVNVIPWLTDVYPLGDCNGYPNAPPAVNFTWDPISPTTADLIQFIDTSTDDGTIVNWSWDFGDGNISYLQNPMHQYADNGTYNVTLTVVDDDTESNMTWKFLVVLNAHPDVDFTWAPLNPTTQDLIQFTDLSTDKSVEEWDWDFGDGYGAHIQHPQHQYDDNGWYNVTLTVTDDDGDSNATTKMLYVSNMVPIVDFTYMPVTPTTNDTIAFTDNSSDVDGSIVNWSWDFGDGNNSFDSNPLYQYSNSGNYTVCLTVMDDDGDVNTSCVYIFVSSLLGQIDVNQSISDRGFPIRHAVDGDWAAAQNFTPTVNTITSASVYLRKFGTPEFNLTVELRENHPQGTLLDTQVFTPAEVPSSWEWFTVDFEDEIVDSGTDYFIVIPPAPSGVTTSFGYEWGYSFGDVYADGSFWFTRDGGGLWRDLPDTYEFTFRTYGYL